MKLIYIKDCAVVVVVFVTFFGPERRTGKNVADSQRLTVIEKSNNTDRRGKGGIEMARE